MSSCAATPPARIQDHHAQISEPLPADALQRTDAAKQPGATRTHLPAAPASAPAETRIHTGAPGTPQASPIATADVTSIDGQATRSRYTDNPIDENQGRDMQIEKHSNPRTSSQRRTSSTSTPTPARIAKPQRSSSTLSPRTQIPLPHTRAATPGAQLGANPALAMSTTHAHRTSGCGYSHAHTRSYARSTARSKPRHGCEHPRLHSTTTQRPRYRALTPPPWLQAHPPPCHAPVAGIQVHATARTTALGPRYTARSHPDVLAARPEPCAPML